MKRLFAVLICLSLLLGTVTVLAEGGSLSSPRVNQSDADAPELVKVVIKENRKTLKPGDVLHVQVQLDDRSYISIVSVDFINAAKGTRFSMNLHYDGQTDMFTGERLIEKKHVNGSYVLTYISAIDEYGNTLTLEKDGKGLGSFKLSGATGSLEVKGTAVIRENGQTFKSAGGIHVDVTTKKALENVDHAEAVFQVEGRDDMTYSFWCVKDSPKEFSSYILLDKSFPGGKWTLKEVCFYDYSFTEEDYTLIGRFSVSGQSFTFRGGISDTTPPKLSSVTLKEKNKTLTAGDTVHVSLKVKDKSTVSVVYASLIDKEPAWYWDEAAKTYKSRSKGALDIYLNYNPSSKKWEGSAQLPEYLADGKYSLFISAWDEANNFTKKTFDKLSITFSSPDYVESWKAAFICECWNAIWGKDPTDSEIRQYGLPLVTGKKKAVSVIRTLVTKAGLSGETAAKALWQIMQGTEPAAADLSKTINALKTGLDYAIDSLNNAAFRQRCFDWGIKPGSLGTKASTTEDISVDVDGGHYTLNGSKATLTGVTDRNITSLVIPDTVSANGRTYKVTKIEGAACMGLSRLAGVTIGKNVTAIGLNAFRDCKKLKTITISGTKLKTVGADAFAGISSKATFKCPKKHLEKYKKLIRKNAPKKAKFK